MTYIENKKNNLLNRINVLILVALFFLMEFSYINSVAVVFEYAGFKLSSVLIFKKIFAYIIITLIIYVVNFKLTSVFEKIITQLIAIFLLFPATVMFVHSNTDSSFLNTWRYFINDSSSILAKKNRIKFNKFKKITYD